MGFADAVGPVVRLLKSLDGHVQRSYEFGQQHAGTKAAGTLNAHEIPLLDGASAPLASPPGGGLTTLPAGRLAKVPVV